jgi:DNA-binding XRE family transcriptional regulator
MPNDISTERTQRRQHLRELLGFDLTSARLARRLTQEGLASIIGVTRRTCSAWELGEYAPELPHLLALRRMFVGDVEALDVVAV